jgi:hypothetical protein
MSRRAAVRLIESQYMGGRYLAHDLVETGLLPSTYVFPDGDTLAIRVARPVKDLNALVRLQKIGVSPLAINERTGDNCLLIFADVGFAQDFTNTFLMDDGLEEVRRSLAKDRDGVNLLMRSVCF